MNFRPKNINEFVDCDEIVQAVFNDNLDDCFSIAYYHGLEAALDKIVLFFIGNFM